MVCSFLLIFYVSEKLSNANFTCTFPWMKGFLLSFTRAHTVNYIRNSAHDKREFNGRSGKALTKICKQEKKCSVYDIAWNRRYDEYNLCTRWILLWLEKRNWNEGKVGVLKWLKLNIFWVEIKRKINSSDLEKSYYCFKKNSLSRILVFFLLLGYGLNKLTWLSPCLQVDGNLKN